MPLLDWIGLDLKAPRAAYPRITGVLAAGDAVFDSLRLILNAGVDSELRCTWCPDLLSAADLDNLGYELIALGANRLVIQECRPRDAPASAHWWRAASCISRCVRREARRLETVFFREFQTMNE